LVGLVARAGKDMVGPKLPEALRDRVRTDRGRRLRLRPGQAHRALIARMISAIAVRRDDMEQLEGRAAYRFQQGRKDRLADMIGAWDVLAGAMRAGILLPRAAVPGVQHDDRRVFGSDLDLRPFPAPIAFAGDIPAEIRVELLIVVRR